MINNDMELLTPKETSRLLKINYRKILDLITLGEIDAYKLGGVYRITMGSIIKYLEKNKVKNKHLM